MRIPVLIIYVVMACFVSGMSSLSNNANAQRKLPPAHIIMKRRDGNGDNKISTDEWRGRRPFTSLDTDSDGFISFSELHSVYGGSGVVLSRSPSEDRCGSREKSPFQLIKTGRANWKTVSGSLAQFNHQDSLVKTWLPKNTTNPPVMVYAHDGAGFTEADGRRVSMFREHGFATVSFDAFRMNGLDDPKWINRNVSNIGKQRMIIQVLKGAIGFALDSDDFDTKNIFLYGQSNGGMAVVNALECVSGDDKIRAIIAEGMAAGGLGKPNLKVPVRLYYGNQDNWGGVREDDFLWKRAARWMNNKISIEDWVIRQKNAGNDFKLVFFQGAGHSFHSGNLTAVERKLATGKSVTGYIGAENGVVSAYEKALFDFVNSRLHK